MHSVNATSDAFGNGIFDGWSIVTGHESSEAVTDPDNFTSIQDGWNDDTTMETLTSAPGSTCRTSRWADTESRGSADLEQRGIDSTGNGCAVSR